MEIHRRHDILRARGHLLSVGGTPDVLQTVAFLLAHFVLTHSNSRCHTGAFFLNQ